MRKTLNYLAIVVAILLALLLAAAGIIAATFDPNDYKPLLIRLVQEKQQRTLRIPGDIKLSFFPGIGADLGRVSLSEPGDGAAEFAAIDSARVSLALLPLLARQVVVDQVRIEGLRANIVRFKDGSTNVDDLLARDASSAGPPLRINVGGIRLGHARLVFDDRQQGRRFDIANLEFDTGKIADRAPGKLQFAADIRGTQPQIDARIAAKTGFTLDLKQKHVALKGLAAEFQGGLSGFTDLALKLSGDADGDIEKQLFTAPQLILTLSGKQGDAAFGATLRAPVSADLNRQQIEVPKLAAEVTLPNPGGGTLNLRAAGNAAIHLGKQTASALLQGTLDQSRFDARLGLSGFSPARYTFDLGIDQLDLDRYRSSSSAAAAAPAPSERPKQAEPPMDFSALQKLQANGSVRIGALKAAGLRSSNVRLDLRAAGGKLDANPVTAGLYGGTLAGSLSLAAGRPARVALRQTLSGINLGPLLKDATGKAPIDGRGNVQLDVSAAGTSVDQIRKGLNGSARLELRDGAIRGVNIAQAVRSAKARLGQLRGDEAPQAGTASAAEKTDFSEMRGSFRIVNGVAHNDDLSIKSPLLRVAGAGQIDLGDERIDYVARTTVVSTLQGQGGPELQALKGLTVPVRLTGPLAAIAWRVDFAGMATELAQQKLGERKEEVKAKAQKSLDEQKAKIRDQLKEQLKGLLGK